MTKTISSFFSLLYCILGFIILYFATLTPSHAKDVINILVIASVGNFFISLYYTLQLPNGKKANEVSIL